MIQVSKVGTSSCGVTVCLDVAIYLHMTKLDHQLLNFFRVILGLLLQPPSHEEIKIYGLLIYHSDF